VLPQLTYPPTAKAIAVLVSRQQYLALKAQGLAQGLLPLAVAPVLLMSLSELLQCKTEGVQNGLCWRSSPFDARATTTQLLVARFTQLRRLCFCAAQIGTKTVHNLLSPRISNVSPSL
jgi:hypothetical protein